MGLFSFLKGSSASDAQRAGTPDPVQAARARARRRLIGAAALLGVGVIGFPLLFETQPRPIPVDIPIEIPKKEGAPSLPLPPPRTASAAPATARVSSGVVSERTTEPARESSATVTRTEAAPSTEPRRDSPPARSEPAPKATPAPKTTPPPEARNDGARARALLEGQTPASAASPATKPATVVAAAQSAKPAPSTDAGRFVVQVGAYGEANSARDMRQRVDKLGLKSYTQVVEIDGAKRIRVRVGPFAAREDAEKAAGTLKAAGLPAAVLTL
ncbi:MAG TPA: SPOR domain-containing protein [Burkholderiaceae bacterium]|nr:SPOR domain-containing protein [Burkholderiaceae bacterium]